MSTTVIAEIPQNQQPVSPGRFAWYIFLSGIPLIGLILLLVWAFSSNENIHKKNWAKGMLILMIIGYVLIILFFVLGMGTLMLAELGSN